ncbi:hypothetical protein M404DRAFT_618075 [Pisolithus tinctorius Marx 270]|uniref:Uncharacterized protein n=1 Tax=Pisolithus tinctorius Marx 270 TaxID=870435 RepID=A0A0C3P7F9_PISTI|nr:hypothetical protein M404DRAFT_618075 [Pisolithus tinctorius Marx 270]
MGYIFLVGDGSIRQPARARTVATSGPAQPMDPCHLGPHALNATAVIRSRAFGLHATPKYHMSSIRLTPVPTIDGSEQRKY